MSNNYQFNPWLSDAKTYAAGVTFEQLIEKYGFRREEILRLAGNESTIGVSPLAIEAAKEALGSSNYYDEPNSEELMNALHEKFKPQTPQIERLGFVVGNGMDKIIEHTLCLFIKPGDTVVNFNPTFDFYSFCALKMGAKILDLGRHHPNDENISNDSLTFQPKIENIQADIERHESETGSQVKIIFLCTPNNPTGNILSLNEVEKVAKYANEKNIILFVDHAYIEFTDRDRFEASKIIHKYPNMVIGYTFSKAYGLAGYRIGYGLMHQELKDIYLKYNTPFLCAKPSLKAAKAALQDTEHSLKIINNNALERPKLEAALLKLGFKVYPSATNFILFETPESSDKAMEYLFSKAIILRRSLISSPNAIRMTIGRAEENLRVIKALEEFTEL